jgi:hypothetical protein
MLGGGGGELFVCPVGVAPAEGWLVGWAMFVVDCSWLSPLFTPLFPGAGGAGVNETVTSAECPADTGTAVCGTAAGSGAPTKSFSIIAVKSGAGAGAGAG